MKYFTSLIILLACWTSNALEYAVGFDQTILYSKSDRPLKASFWYPSKTTFPKERVAENPAFMGTDVVRIGTPLKGKYPLMVISHGYRGSWRNQNWLATKFAKQGYVVATVDHPGTTTFNHSPKIAAQWWERPRDISRLIDWIIDESDFQDLVDIDNITATGHSLGGWTVMVLAGAEFDREQLKQECILKPNSRVCGLAVELGLADKQKNEPSISLKDDRIKQVVSLDLGLARSLSRESLKGLNTRILILAAGIDIGDLPQAKESGFIAKWVPKINREYKVYNDATHFSFMQLCKPGAIEMIEEETPGDGIVCKDGNERSRKELHQIIFKDILTFVFKA